MLDIEPTYCIYTVSCFNIRRHMALGKRKGTKSAQTIREKTKSLPKNAPKTRRLQATASSASRPFKAGGRLVLRVIGPLRFILRPFKTRPVRFVGRFLASVLLLRYVRNSWKELRQVTWPNRKETRQLTTAVFLFAIVFGALVTVTDFGLDKVFKKVLLQ